jgi:hypothetical protein
MNSPFPGMDPYMERHWRDVHQVLVTYSRDSLNSQLPRDLVARTEERVAVETPEDLVRVVFPGARVAERRGVSGSGQSGDALAVASPVMIEIEAEEATEGYVVIMDAGGRLVTTIEYLSPTNKRGEGLREYLRKRQELLSAGVNVVEVDLARRGNWRPLIRPKVVPERLGTTYRVMIRRARHPRGVEYYPIPLQDPLPAIAVPLRDSDADVALDLQALLNQAYKNGRYDALDYTQDCDPALEGEELEWAQGMLPAAGKR